MARLHYVYDSKPGYTRKKLASGFAFFDTKGSRIKSEKIITRIKKLAVPPAYKDVWYSGWICFTISSRTHEIYFAYIFSIHVVVYCVGLVSQ